MHPLAVYLHIPFCVRKCNYCDFFSVVARPDQIDRYGKAVIAEITAAGEQLNHPEVDTIFLGGGTPSLLPPVMVGQIVEAMASAFLLPPAVEISMEANPGTVSYSAWKQYINRGVNRISLGAQSLADQNLKLLGRVHTVEDIYGAVSALQRIGFDNYNLDLIYGIPGQTEEGLKRELVLLKSFLGSHLSAYSLQVEEGTPLYDLVEAGSLIMPDEDVTANMYEMIQTLADDQGLKQYELSNWAKRGYECRHNLAYWQMHPYLGLGAGAVSRLDKRRFKNVSDIEAYISGAATGKIPQETLETLDQAAMVQEKLIMGLRLTEGISLSAFRQEFGQDIDYFYPSVIAQAINEGSLTIENEYLKLTPPTYLVANQVLCRF